MRKQIVVGALVVLAGFLLAPMVDSQAGEKKQDDKKVEKKQKGEPKKAGSIFSKSDEITDQDEKDTNPLVANSRRKVYKVKFTEGKTYQIDLKSSDFDAFLRLEDPAGKELAFNDDVPGAKTFDSRIVHKAAKTGDYRIIATTLIPKNGKFTVTVIEADEIPVVSIFKAKGMDLKLKDGKARYEGELTDKDAVAIRPYKLFTVQLEEGKTYQIDQRNNGADKAFDAYLFLEDGTGNTLAANDDVEPGNLDSRIVHKAAKTDTYRIIATTLGMTPPHGKFVLEVTAVEMKAKGAKEQVRRDEQVESGAVLARGEKKKEADKDGLLIYKSEVLGNDDPKDTKLKKSYAKTYTVKLTEGQVYRIDLSSKDFDTYLRLENSAGKEVAFNDDIDLANKILDSRILYPAPKTGEYKIIVTSYEPGSTGDFTLMMKLASDAEAKDARFQARIDAFADVSPADQRKLIQEVTKRFEGKGEDLDLKDAQMAASLFMSADDSDPKFVREFGESFAKIFAGASNKNIASLSPYLRKQMKSLDKIGTTIDIAGMTTDDKKFDLAKLKGKVVLVDFWATWCGPCIEELPNVQAMYKKYHGKGFEVIGVSLDREGQEKKLAKFIETEKLPWACINIEDSRKLADQYDVASIPYPVLVGADGRIVSLRARGPQLERLLEKLLKDKK